MEITFYNVSIEKNIKIYDFIYKSRNFILYLNGINNSLHLSIYKSRNFILYLNTMQWEDRRLIYKSRNFILYLNK